MEYIFFSLYFYTNMVQDYVIWINMNKFGQNSNKLVWLYYLKFLMLLNTIFIVKRRSKLHYK